MEALVRHLVEPIVRHPEAVQLKTVEGEAVVVLELVVHPEDRERVEGDKGRTLRAIRNVLSAAAGSRKATLDLLEEHRGELSEDGDDDSDDDDSEESEESEESAEE